MIRNKLQWKWFLVMCCCVFHTQDNNCSKIYYFEQAILASLKVHYQQQLLVLWRCFMAFQLLVILYIVKRNRNRGFKCLTCHWWVRRPRGWLCLNSNAAEGAMAFSLRCYNRTLDIGSNYIFTICRETEKKIENGTCRQRNLFLDMSGTLSLG